MTTSPPFENPFRPGAGHAPPFFAGRTDEQQNFSIRINSARPLESVLICGKRGFGKTALLEQFKQTAAQSDWIWVSNALSQSSALNVERLVSRVITDLSAALATRMESDSQAAQYGNQLTSAEPSGRLHASVYSAIQNAYENACGTPADRLSVVLIKAGILARQSQFQGILLAYDDASYLRASRGDDALVLNILNAVAATQAQSGVAPSMLVLSGLKDETRGNANGLAPIGLAPEISNLPTARVDRLNVDEAYLAISAPIKDCALPFDVNPELIYEAARLSGGHPFLVQVLGKDLFDQLVAQNGVLSACGLPSSETVDLLETGFFAILWNKSDYQHQKLLRAIVNRDGAERPSFSLSDISLLMEPDDWDSDQTRRLLGELCEIGILYQTQHEIYAFTTPMSEPMIMRRLNYLDEMAAWSARERRGSAVRS